MTKNKLSLLICAIAACALISCATGYQPMGFKGGYEETRLDDNVFKINYSGNALTDLNTTTDYALLRSAEVALMNGCEYFIITDSKNYTEDKLVQEAAKVTKVGKNTVVTPGATYTNSYPRSSNTITCFAEKPNVSGTIYKSSFIIEELRRKHKIKAKGEITPSKKPTVVASAVSSYSEARPLNNSLKIENGVVLGFIQSHSASEKEQFNNNLVIPEKINGQTVTAIGKNAFKEYKFTSVTIPNSVTIIEDGAFYYNKLTSVTIPSGVTSIGDHAFFLNELTSITIPNKVTTIKKGAFRGNRLTSVTIPSNVAFIGEMAFYSNRLTSVTISNGVTTIENEAFRSNQLTSVTIPSSVTKIGGGAFSGNPLSEVILDPGNAAYIDKNSFILSKNENQLVMYHGSEKNIVIPSSVTTVANRAFFENKLTSVTIPSSVVVIEDYAFMGNQLTSIAIPSSVTQIGTWAFARNQLASVDIPSSITSIESLVFIHNKLTSIDIPNSVTKIGFKAFNDNQLTSVTIGANVGLSKEVFDDAFNDVYDSEGKTAGTYTLNNGRWSRN